MTEKTPILMIFCIILLFVSEIQTLGQTKHRTSSNPHTSLGVYADSNISTNGNVTIAPSAFPADTLRTTGYTSPDFRGVITVNPGDGNVRITNAHPAGIYIINIRAYGLSGTAATTFTLRVQPSIFCGSLTFNSFFTTDSEAVPSGPISMAVGDFDRDSDQDFAVASQRADRTSIWINNGMGDISLLGSPYASNVPYSLTIGDFDGDGNQDFATANSGDPGISIRFGNGTGGFSTATNIPSNEFSLSITSGDLNNDGVPDLVTSNVNAGTVSLFIGNGSGTFSSAPGSPFPVDIGPRELNMGDFNEDGKPDIAVATPGNSSVSVLYGNGLGGFLPYSSYHATVNTESLTTTDFDNDNHLDLAVGGSSSPQNISVIFGSGAGTFNNPINLAIPGLAAGIKTADFNGDGNEDLAVSTDGGSVYILLGNGARNFSSPINYGNLGAMIFSSVIGDFNSDGRPDFATANYGSNSVSIVLNRCLAPTAANAFVKGRILTSEGMGIGNVKISLNGNDSITFNTVSNPFGYFTFEDIPTGATYFLTVQSKKYRFTQPTLALTLLQDTDDLVFLGVLE